MDEPEQELDPKIQDGVRVALTQLDQASRKIGLYIEDVHVHVGFTSDDAPGVPSHMSVCVDYLVGDRAFSPTVMDPQSAAFAKEVDGAVADSTDEQWNELEQRYRKGQLGWRPDE